MTRADRARQRQLASEKRAGAWLRRTSVERQYAFLRKNSAVIVGYVAIYLVVVQLVWLQPGWARGLFVGALIATWIWMLVLVTWQLSGVGYLQQAELAELWTVQELRPLTKSESWRLINHVLFRRWDIDHVLIGPAGVVVIETKGGASDWTERRHAPRIHEAVAQVTGNAVTSAATSGARSAVPLCTPWSCSGRLGTRSSA